MATITTRTLSCGMPLILESMSGVRSVGVTWLVPAGSATDPEERQGLCTMWSELLLRGAGELDSRAQADAMDRLGLSRSADVATLHLRIGFTLLGSRLMDALPLMVDMVRRPRMDVDTIDPSRELALQALEGLKDDPQERAMLALRARHNDWPLNRTGMGTEAGLRAISRADLVEGWARQVRPTSGAGAGKAILAIAGDLESAGGPEAVIKSVDKLLAGWTGQSPGISAKASPTRGSYEHVPDESAAQVQIALLHEAPPESSPESRFERVLSSVLSGGMSARLFSEVREKRGLCYSVSESYSAERDFGRCLAYVGTTSERAQQSLDVLVSELQKVSLPDGRITPDEFQRAMIGLRSGLVFSGESSGARASALAGDMHKLGRARSLEEMLELYAEVKLDDVNGYLSRRRMGPTTIVTLGPASLVPPRV